MSTTPVTNPLWRNRFFVAATIVAWIIIAAVVLWGLGHVTGPIVLLVISALLAYIIYPLVKLLHRVLPRPLAVLIAFLVMLALLFFVIYFVVIVAIQQLVLLISFGEGVVQHPENYTQFKFIVDWLSKVGVSPPQFGISTQQVLSYVERAINGIVPFISGVFGLLINGIIVASLCVYFMTDGGRVIDWLRHKTPEKQRGQINFLLDVVQKSLGGYIRGQVILAVVVTAIISVGAIIVGVPYVILIAVIVFVCEFIPIIGAYISGVIVIIISLATGVQSAIIMIVFITFVNGVLEGQILAPRILGQSIGLHPIISITALLVGSQLFGILGAVLAAPLAGILQTIIITIWSTWRAQHPDQFPDETPTREEVTAPPTVGI